VSPKVSEERIWIERIGQNASHGPKWIRPELLALHNVFEKEGYCDNIFKGEKFDGLVKSVLRVRKNSTNF
jgi:hypothetical protein